LLSLVSTRKRSSRVLPMPRSNSSSFSSSTSASGPEAPTTWRQSLLARFVASIVT
jgi:hypothetical protein